VGNDNVTIAVKGAAQSLLGMGRAIAPEWVWSRRVLPLHAAVWDRYVGAGVASHGCFCCKTRRVAMHEAELGSVVSEANGGAMVVDNLRPVCGACSRSMGDANMVAFVVKNEYFI
jgi:hypothetical protein